MFGSGPELLYLAVLLSHGNIESRGSDAGGVQRVLRCYSTSNTQSMRNEPVLDSPRRMDAISWGYSLLKKRPSHLKPIAFLHSTDFTVGEFPPSH